MTPAIPEKAKRPLTDSLFYMWRCIIVMAHADGVMHEKEMEFFDKTFAGMGRAYEMTPEHYRIIGEDLKTAQDIDTLLPKVTDPEFRSLLLYFSQVVAWIDGNLSPEESELLKKLHKELGRSQATEQVMAQIRQEMADQMLQRKSDLVQQKQLQRNPLFYALDALLLRLGIDPLD